MECNYSTKPLPYLPVCLDIKNGKLWPNDRPGLGVELDMKPLTLLLEVDKPTEVGQYYNRPDGSLTNW
jgi:hypothetical protein